MTEFRLNRVGQRLAFPSVHSPVRPMSENTLNAALRRLGYSRAEAAAHGSRASASTLIAGESLQPAEYGNGLPRNTCPMVARIRRVLS